MSGKKNALALIVGLGSGYMQGKRQQAQDDERQADRAQRNELHTARMDELDRGKRDRQVIADAVRPAKINEGAATLDMGDGAKVYESMDVAGSDQRQATRMGLESVQAPQQALMVNGQQMADRPAAEEAVATHNAPAARNARLADAYMQTGNPDKALSLESSQAKAQQDQLDRTKKLQEEGVFDGLKALRAGDGVGMATAFNKGGQLKIEGVPEVTKEMRDIPGIGNIATYTAKVKMIGPDGKVFEKVVNSHDMSMAMMPYEKQMELMRKGSDSEQKSTYQSAIIDAKGAALEAKSAALDYKRRNGGGSGGSGGNNSVTREERMRATTLFSDAGRRMSDAQKALTDLQKEPMYANAKPGTPRHAELEGLRSTIKAYSEEREIYGTMLAGDKAPARPGLADAEPKPGAKPAPRPAPAPGKKPDFSNLWK